MTPRPRAVAAKPDEPAKPHVLAYTDGACLGNPGPGGWAFILKHPASGKTLERAGGQPDTTNNRMELTAVINCLSTLSRPSTVDLYSDSKYVLDGLSQWLKSWKARGWKTATKAPVKNDDLWKALDQLAAAHDLRTHWVRGHSGHPENERCDQLASAEAENLLGADPAR